MERASGNHDVGGLDRAVRCLEHEAAGVAREFEDANSRGNGRLAACRVALEIGDRLCACEEPLRVVSVVWKPGEVEEEAWRVRAGTRPSDESAMSRRPVPARARCGHVVDARGDDCNRALPALRRSRPFRSVESFSGFAARNPRRPYMRHSARSSALSRNRNHGVSTRALVHTPAECRSTSKPRSRSSAPATRSPPMPPIPILPLRGTRTSSAWSGRRRDRSRRVRASRSSHASSAGVSPTPMRSASSSRGNGSS